MDVPREYVKLGLRFGRLQDGLVDSYIGDRELRRDVAAEPSPEPARLAARARELLRELPGAGLAADRVAYLAGQLTALECAASRMAGARLSYLDEVEAYLQVRPGLADPDEYAKVHRTLDELLPGSGDLAGRYADYREHDRCPPPLLPAAIHALSGALRTRVLDLLGDATADATADDTAHDAADDAADDAAGRPPGGPTGGPVGDCAGGAGNGAVGRRAHGGVERGRGGLPDGEEVEYLLVNDRPWSGFNYYLGDYRSRIAVNADLSHRFVHLPQLVAHEAYPGHHTENCRKQRCLVERGRVEHSIHLVNTPECLLTEGLADLGLHVAVGPGWGRWTGDVLRDAGVDTGEGAGGAARGRGGRFDGELAELAERVSDAAAGLDRVRQDAAIMLYDLGWDESSVVSYLCRWLLVSERRARDSLRFVADPLWRAYTSTYVEGRRLLAAWLDARPAGQSLPRRFARLLDEPLTPARLAVETPAPAGMT